MLTNTHFLYLFVAFIVSVLLGFMIRVLYYSKGKKFFIRRMYNIIILMLVFPFIAYKDIVKHKTEYIRKVNRDGRLTKEQKDKIKKNISSDRRVALRVLTNYIINFKSILDAHINFLNNLREKSDGEPKVKVEIVIKRAKVDDMQFYRKNIMEVYSHN